MNCWGAEAAAHATLKVAVKIFGVEQGMGAELVMAPAERFIVGDQQAT